MFPLAAVGQRNSAGRGPVGKGVRIGRWTSRVSGPPGGRSASCRSPASPRRSRRRARGRSARWSRSPATRCVSTPDAGGARGRGRDARLHRLARHLRQRDDPPRRRHPPRPRAARQGPLRLRALPARRPQRRQLLAAGPRPRPTASRDEWEIDPAPRGDRRRPGPRRGPRGLGRARRPDRWSAARSRCPARRSRAARPTSCSPRSASAAGPSGCSTSCCASARSATASAPIPTG